MGGVTKILNIHWHEDKWCLWLFRTKNMHQVLLKTFQRAFKSSQKSSSLQISVFKSLFKSYIKSNWTLFLRVSKSFLEYFKKLTHLFGINFSEGSWGFGNLKIVFCFGPAFLHSQCNIGFQHYLGLCKIP